MKKETCSEIRTYLVLPRGIDDVSDGQKAVHGDAVRGWVGNVVHIP